MDRHDIRVAIVGAGRIAGSIDDEIVASDHWPSLKSQLPYHFRKMREIIVSGELGELISVTSWITSALLHTLSHMTDTCLYLAGDARPVSAFGVLGAVKMSYSFDPVSVPPRARRQHEPQSGS